jgi:DNA-binding GntR family transcriptional regulator
MLYTGAMSLSDLVTPLKRQTLSANVYEQLKELVMSGQMMPGEQFSLRSTATALGVSVMPVREAIQRLVAEQALEVTPNRAMRVPTMTASQFREITRIRINLEGLATEQAASSWTDAGLRQIMQWDERFSSEMATGKPNGTRLITFNKELHFAIYGAAKMPLLLQMIEALWLRIGPILNYDLRSGSRRIEERVAVSHHADLVKALQQRDGAAARVALQGDIESAADFILSAGGLVSADAPGQPEPLAP